MKTTIKFRDAAYLPTEGSFYVCVDTGSNRKDGLEDHVCSWEMLEAAVNALGDYNVVGIATTNDEPCFIIRQAEGDGQKCDSSK